MKNKNKQEMNIPAFSDLKPNCLEKTHTQQQQEIHKNSPKMVNQLSKKGEPPAINVMNSEWRKATQGEPEKKSNTLQQMESEVGLKNGQKGKS